MTSEHEDDDKIEIDSETGLPRALLAAGKLGDHGTTYGLVADLRPDGKIEIWAVEAVGNRDPVAPDKEGDVLPQDAVEWRAFAKLATCHRQGEDYTADMPKCWTAAGERRLALLLYVGSETTDPAIEWPSIESQAS